MDAPAGSVNSTWMIACCWSRPTGAPISPGARPAPFSVSHSAARPDRHPRAGRGAWQSGDAALNLRRLQRDASRQALTTLCAVAGTLRVKVPAHVAERHLQLLVFDLHATAGGTAFA